MDSITHSPLEGVGAHLSEPPCESQLEGRAPSYKGLRPVSLSASQAKRKTGARDTAPELLLRRTLWQMGLRFRKNVTSLPGKPDIVFPGAHMAVFCDGDFWHGRHWESLQAKLQHGTNPAYWVAKIASNIARDRSHSQALADAGWRVVRLWETDIKRDPAAAAAYIADKVRSRHVGGGAAREW